MTATRADKSAGKTAKPAKPAKPAKKAAKPAKKASNAVTKTTTPAKKASNAVAKTATPAKPAKKAAKAPAAAPAPFTGFPKDFLAFFRELEKNNDREWFAANKPRYKESVEAPLLSFIAAIDLPLGRFASSFVAIAKTQGGSMFRIYRDTRFSHDKKPYKENAGLWFRHEAARDVHAPGFYVHLSPKEVFFGGGIWMPPSAELRMVREAIVADPERWTAVTRAAAFRRRFGGVEGDGLKRAPAGFDPAHPLVEDLKRASFFAAETATPSSIQSKDFLKTVVKSFQATVPFMEFLTDAVGLTFHRED
ncbi:MAG: DUF2461 domain-containing protein [Candidatus Binatia bacterium]